MGRNHKFNQCCIHCGELLTTANTNISLIRDKQYICYECIDDRIGKRTYPNINLLIDIYDFDNVKAHKKIDKQSNRHITLLEKLIQPQIPKIIKYPIPKGQLFIIGLKEIECTTCGIVLSTTNTTKAKIKHQYYNCNICQKNLDKERDIDPLYKRKKEIKSLLLALHTRRAVRQFTWEYVEKRFATSAQPIPIVYKQEDYDKVTSLFGNAYARKVFHTAPIIQQESFGDLSIDYGCKKLITLFQNELMKSRNVGRKRQQQYSATAWATSHDPRYEIATSYNSLEMNDVIVMDPAYLKYYSGHQCELKRECSYEEIKLNDYPMPDILTTNEGQKKLIEIQRQKTILNMLTEPSEIKRQKKTIIYLYEDLVGHENMNWNKFFDNLRFLEYEVPEEFK